MFLFEESTMMDLRILILFCLLVVKTSALRTGKDVKRFQEEDQEEQTFESLEHYFASRLQEDKNTKSDPIKGQLISKCPFGVIIWTKIPTKNLTNFCPRI